MGADSILQMPEELSIANVTEWQQALGDFAKDADNVTLDAENLSRVDTAALQLLTAFFVMLKSQQKEVSWLNPSDTLVRTAKQLGLETTLLLNND